MGIQERKEREREERRNLILQAAEDIITREGLEGLSLRKIAERIEYSPAAVYHYFNNKEDILEQLLHRQYADLLRTMGALKETENPETKIADLGRRYIHWALKNPELYKVLIMSDSPHIVKGSSVLFRGATRERPAMRLLAETMKELTGREDEEVELAAQMVWVTTFGLIIRMITEETSPEQRRRLIDYHSEFTVKAVKAALA